MRGALAISRTREIVARQVVELAEDRVAKTDLEVLLFVAMGV